MKTKRCTKCGKDFSIDCFVFRNKAKGIRHNYCKECRSADKSKFYQRNKAEYIAKSAKTVASNRIKFRKKLHEYLREHPCVDCGESDIVCLDFDHIEPKDKSFAIAHAIYRGYSRDKIYKEIQKCEIRCANCHRRKTAKQFNWHKYLL